MEWEYYRVCAAPPCGDQVVLWAQAGNLEPGCESPVPGLTTEGQGGQPSQQALNLGYTTDSLPVHQSLWTPGIKA